jgi:plasmid stabilization system protein ParE
VTLPVEFALEAEAELYAAEQWYGGPAAPPAQAFLRAIHARLADIQRFPASHQLVYRNLRRAPLRRYPYAIIYRVERERIVVVSIFHVRRDPRIWQERAED